MILKPYQLVNMKSKTSNYYLFYGQNEGQKNEVIQKIINDKFTKNIYRYDEDEILNNYDNLLNELSNKSFFEDKKMLIISRVTDKIISFIEDVKERNIRDIKIIINSKALDKKSKLRASFEKDKELVCVVLACAQDKKLPANFIQGVLACANSLLFPICGIKASLFAAFLPALSIKNLPCVLA